MSTTTGKLRVLCVQVVVKPVSIMLKSHFDCQLLILAYNQSSVRTSEDMA